MLGLEVDAIETSPMSFEGVVVVKVLSTERHPDADKLCVASVSDGQETLQIVCGAPNCRVGIVTALAKVGATLTDEKGESFKIKKAKLRGIESSGMLCTGKELGISEDHEGILELSADSTLGSSLSELYGDAVFEITLTPNLGHCASLQGVLRELSAYLDKSYALPQVYIDDQKGEDIAKLATVNVQDSAKCPRYACRVIRNVKVGPSPQWLQKRLEQCGLRPVNNVVDATNYVLWELGHPLHAFDYDKLSGKCINVRCATSGEAFVTLDGQTRQLSQDALLICDAEKAVALAGIMGGQCSEVDDGTTHVLLESAYFEPTNIRRTSKALGLSTEASRRFERGADPNGVLVALDRTAVLIQELAGGDIAQGVIDVHVGQVEEKKITCRLSRINAIIGETLTISEVEGIFRRLGFPSNWDGQHSFFVRIPTYRADIHGEIDLIEEIARIYGYHNIVKKPGAYQASSLPHAPIFMFERLARQRLIGQGLLEFITCDLIGPTALNAVAPGPVNDSSQIHVLSPTSVEQSVLRQSLLPGMLQAVKYNIDRKNQNIVAFEIGRIHLREGSKFKEQSVAGIILSGKSRPHHWDQHPGPFDFYDLKGLVEDFLEGIGVPSPTFELSKLATFHPGRQANVLLNGIDVGAVGEVHPDVIRRLDVPQRILFAELNLHDLFPLRSATPKMQELPQYPGSERDWTITIEEATASKMIFDLIRRNAPSLLENVSLIALYRSDKVGMGYKNVTFRFSYRDRTKTIQQEDVDAKHTRLVTKVTEELGTAVRQTSSNEIPRSLDK